MPLRETETRKQRVNVGLGERLMNFPPRPRGRNGLDPLIADDDRGHRSERYTACRTPTRQEIGGNREANILAEEAKAVWGKALDFSG
jgi:hypothetical protein